MAEKNVSLMEFEGSANTGLYFFVIDKFCILGKEVDDEKKAAIEKVLEVPMYKTTILGTDLVGVFASGNNEYLFLPEIYDYEKEEFEKIAKAHDMKIVYLGDRLNTLGNNLLFGKKHVFYNGDYPKKVVDLIKKETKYKMVPFTHVDYKSIGGVGVYANGKYFLSQEMEEKQFGEILKEIGGVGSVNAGSNYVASGIVGNKFGVLIGSMSTSVEIQNIVEGLEYI